MAQRKESRGVVLTVADRAAIGRIMKRAHARARKGRRARRVGR